MIPSPTRIDGDGLDVTADDVRVLRNTGPKGAPGMPEAGCLPIPKKLARQGVKDMARISDAWMICTAFGTIVLRITPESAVGGPLALVRTGDMIRLGAAGRRIDWSRRRSWPAAAPRCRRPRPRPARAASCLQRAAGRQGLRFRRPVPCSGGPRRRRMAVTQPPSLCAPPLAARQLRHAYLRPARRLAAGGGAGLHAPRGTAAGLSRGDALGIDRTVLVQPSVYGTDNLLVATLAEDPAALRGWPWWRPTSGRRIWPRCMRGIRLNTRNPLGLGFADLEPLGRRVVPLGWHCWCRARFPVRRA